MTMRSIQALIAAALALAISLGAQSPDDEYVRRSAITARGLAPSMQVKQLGATGRTFEVTMRKGDEVAAGLTEFAEQNHVTLAHVTAVGALNAAVLGWFDPDKRAYKKIVINQEVEVVSFIGNIAMENGKPFLHAHAVVAFPDGSTKGGHFIEGHVSLEMQIFVVDTDTPSTAAATPLPKVAGPLPVTSQSYPFGAAEHTRVPSDLAKDGYVEEEFLLSGAANVYEWPQPGPAGVRSSNVPYTTRVLVRRPANRAKFSGTVAVEMLNPSNLFDLNLGWTISGEQFARHGDAWVGITAKPVSVVTLKTFNPRRYASLAWPNPLPLDDVKNCATVPRDSERSTENGLVWDIYRQTAAWLRSGDPSNPLAYGASGSDLPVQRLYAWGYSQTGSFLYTYVNAIHPLDVQANGRPLFDGYLIAMASGPSPINQCAAPIPAGDPRREIKNVGVPVVRVMSGSDYLRTIGARRPDGDTAPDLYRNYEIAGSAHATPDELYFAAAPEDILKGGRAVPPMNCNEGPRSRFPNSIAFNAIFQNLDQWVRQGIAPPRSEPIHVEKNGVDSNAPMLDQFGNVTGGIRSPYVDVPTSTWFGNSTGESFCMIAGHEVPFEHVRLKQLYPTHSAYERAVSEDVSALVTQRFITVEDAKNLIEDARKADVP